MEFFRQEYWGGLLFPSPDLPDPGIEPGSLALQADSLPSEPPGKLILLLKKAFKSKMSVFLFHESPVRLIFSNFYLSIGISMF